MTNLDIDLLKEALVVLLRDRYAMPNSIVEYRKKSEIILEMYDRLEAMQSDLTDKKLVTK